MTFSTELLYGGAVRERRTGEPANFLDFSELRSARESKARFRVAQASARAMGRDIPFAIVVMDNGQEAFW